MHIILETTEIIKILKCGKFRKQKAQCKKSELRNFDLYCFEIDNNILQKTL